MESQKIENLLNLALLSSPAELVESSDLSAGYSVRDRTWEILVKYHGNIKQYQTDTIKIEELLAGYCVVRLLESQIEAFSTLEEIEYIEKPKLLFFN